MRFLAALCVFLLLSGPTAAQPLRPWPGGATPPLALRSIEGELHRLAEDYRGKVVLVNFWATWCAPCRAEMPSIDRLRASLADEPFAVLAVNVGENEPAIRAFARQVPLDFPLLVDRSQETTRAWKVRALPVTFIVDPGGRIAYAHVGERDWSDPAIVAVIRSLMPGIGSPRAALPVGR